MRIFASLLLLFMAVQALGQAQLAGTVTSATGAPVPFATIQIKKIDSSQAGATVANDAGAFSFKLPAAVAGEARLLLSITAVGFQKQVISVPRSQWGSVQARMAADNVTTQAVELQVQKAVIQQEAGKTIVNVETSLATSGLTALDVLRRSPGVTVDNQGNIKLKGRDNVLVLIDNKPTQLDAAGLNQLLAGMAADQLGTIELMTNPSAAYDAQGTGGIINLNLRRNKRRGSGANIDVTGGTGLYPKFNANTGGYYATPKVNITGAYSYRLLRVWDQYLQRRTYPDGLIPNLVSDAVGPARGHIHNLRMQADYNLSSRTTVGVGLTGLQHFKKEDGSINTRTFIGDQDLTRTVNRVITPGNTRTLSSRASFSHKLFDAASPGSRERWRDHSLSGYADLALYDLHSQNLAQFQFAQAPLFNYDSSWTMNSNLPARNRVWVGQLDYRMMPAKGWGLEAGAKYTNVVIASAPNINVIDQEGKMVPNVTQRSDYAYDEEIRAWYAIAHYNRGRVSLQAGLRNEHWLAHGLQKLSGLNFERDRLFTLPSASISLNLDSAGNQSLALSYGSRIDRPSYSLLNPQPYYGDPYTIFLGNPVLRPQVADNLELSHMMKGGVLVSTLHYNSTRDLVARYTLSRPAPGQDVQTLSPQNVARRTNYGLSLSYNPNITGWLRGQFFAYTYRSEVTGDYQGFDLNNRLWVAQGNASMQATLGNGWRAEGNWWGQTRVPESVGIQQPIWALGLAVQKQFMGERASLKLAVEDLFYSSIYRAKTDLGTVRTNNLFRWDSRQVLLTFSYKLNRGLANRKKAVDAPADKRIEG